MDEEKKRKLKKRMIIMLLVVGIIFGIIIIIKVIFAVIFHFIVANYVQISSVSTIKVKYEEWQPKMTAVASLRAIKGVNVTTQLSGMVEQIYFTPGAYVEKNAVLVQLNADTEKAQLLALEANAELARITYERDKAQFAVRAISKQQLDSDIQNLKNLRAQVEQQKAVVAKKTITAPFTGRLGISAVNPGQFLNPGDKVVTLQMLDPIYADFPMPQQALSVIRTGMPTALTTDAFGKKTFNGTITTIDPAVDVATRNVQVEATINNPTHQLTPGMFATVEITTGAPQKFLTLPQTAISFNPYGSIVYLVKEQGKDKKGETILIAQQSFVRTGETRGDQIAVLAGVKEGDIVVSAGQLKLKNNSRIAINNSIQPPNDPNPKVNNES